MESYKNAYINNDKAKILQIATSELKFMGEVQIFLKQQQLLTDQN